ncbi:hypothetical protein B9G54_00180 [Alloscardovia macacae]|uniref:Rod shape-determining protein RodA n=1 Tax=Alloscardovia macacae TaxID=1160091 RepID=A0A1Y2SWE9_9BIFI|nr:hypothetical protein B9G54_00180 [Alloscardovia macacae]OTA30293.1 hypothetical protein B9T39_00260 [Alloscardovia macacae]
MEPLWPSLTTVAVVIAAALLGWWNHVDIAAYLFSLYSLVLGTCRLVLRDRAPWKVRSVGFDVFISYALAIGLAVTCFSISLL